MFEAGVRFNEYVYTSFSLDIDNGDMLVKVELVDNDGNVHIITGAVVWDE